MVEPKRVYERWTKCYMSVLSMGLKELPAEFKAFPIEENRKLVLTVSNCEPVTHNKDSENVYVIRGYTRPRKNPLRAKFAMAKPNEDGGLLA